MMQAPAFTPAAGRFMPTSLYDRGVAILTRENKWRDALLSAIAPQAGDTIFDVGCGTGTLAVKIKQRQPLAQVTAIDPDPQALALARTKARMADVEVDWQDGFAHETARFGSFDKVVSSLVLHQMPLDQKHASIEAMLSALGDGGVLYIADYASPSNFLMRHCFKVIQLLDGRADTQPNLDGFIEEKLHTVCGRVTTLAAIDTPTGTISLFAATR